jgi:hypothetical protein
MEISREALCGNTGADRLATVRSIHSRGQSLRIQGSVIDIRKRFGILVRVFR